MLHSGMQQGPAAFLSVTTSSLTRPLKSFCVYLCHIITPLCTIRRMKSNGNNPYMVTLYSCAHENDHVYFLSSYPVSKCPVHPVTLHSVRKYVCFWKVLCSALVEVHGSGVIHIQDQYRQLTESAHHSLPLRPSITLNETNTYVLLLVGLYHGDLSCFVLLSCGDASSQTWELTQTTKWPALDSALRRYGLENFPGSGSPQ